MAFFSPSFHTVSASGALSLGSPVDFAYGLVVAVSISAPSGPARIDLQNPEWAIEAIIAILGAQLPAKLDAIDAAHSDGITLRDIAQYYRGALFHFDALPCLVVIADATEYPDAYRGNEIRHHQMQLELYEESHEYLNGRLPQEVLAARLSRMLTGIHRVLMENETLLVDGVPRACHILIQGIQYSDFVPVEQGVFRGAVMSLQVQFTTIG